MDAEPVGATETGSPFDATASTYDRARRQLIPCFDRFYGTAVERVACHPLPLERVLELGCGTGLFTAMVDRVVPDAALTLVDASSEMLDQARERLGDRAHTRFVQARLEDPLPEGPFDAVVSALAIHHLTDADKRDLFSRIHDGLAPGGLFINVEQVSAGTATLDAAQADSWRQQVIAAGVSEEDLAAADHRMAADICAPVEDQLDWLRRAGMVEVDSPFRDGRFAVLCGRRL